MLTHSRWREDFSSAVLAHSCAEANGAAQRASKKIRVMRFMVLFLPQKTWRPGTEKRVLGKNIRHCNAARQHLQGGPLPFTVHALTRLQASDTLLSLPSMSCRI